jgi:hypothetical protein
MDRYIGLDAHSASCSVASRISWTHMKLNQTIC